MSGDSDAPGADDVLELAHRAKVLRGWTGFVLAFKTRDGGTIIVTNGELRGLQHRIREAMRRDDG